MCGLLMIKMKLFMNSILIDDENYGMPLPIVCKWFNKSRTDEIVEIEGITGAFY